MMNKITSLRFQKISFRNFRIHENASFDLGDLTYITGDNFTGKTSIMHGICYALYGVSFFGQSNIDNLMRENTTNVEVSIVFCDQNNVPHTLTRTRRGNQTGIVLDSRSVRQEDIEQMLCSKDLFLSMFNPSYLPELGTAIARDLLESSLPPVPNEAVLEQLSEQERDSLAGVVISDPALMLKECRASLKELTTEKTRIEGQIDFLKETKETTSQKILTLETELQRTQEAIQKLKSQQFEGIDCAGLQNWLTQMEQMKSGEAYRNADKEIHILSERIQQRQSQQYVSSYQQHLAECDAQLKSLAVQCRKLKTQMESLKPGEQCPNCMTVLTEQCLSVIRNKMSAEYNNYLNQGNQLMAQKKEILALEQKERDTFIQFQEEDIQQMSLQLQQIKESCQFTNFAELSSQMTEAKRILQYGNLNDDQINELNCLESTLPSLRMELDTLHSQDNTQKLKELVDQLAGMDMKREEKQKQISALSEFTAKRSELSMMPLIMPNVQVKLWEVAKSTGELKNVFKFTYKGRNYSSLSLSEKILAGLELSAALRKLSSIDCPVCVDNRESIGSFGTASMPSQVIMLQFINGRELSVNFKNAVENQSLRKAS